jgi:hypothetical protein
MEQRHYRLSAIHRPSGSCGWRLDEISGTDKFVTRATKIAMMAVVHLRSCDNHINVSIGEAMTIDRAHAT